MHMTYIALRHVAKPDKGKREARHRVAVAGFASKRVAPRFPYLQSAFFWLSANGVNCCNACMSCPA